MATAHPLPMPTLSAGIDPPVSIGVYEGPLDLLLLLIRREGLSVREVPLSQVCDAYLRWLEAAGPIDVEVAGDYLVLAATLCQWKARELLPPEEQPEEGEEEPDPRMALEARLALYAQFREAAEALGEREVLDRDVFARPVLDLEVGELPVDGGVGAMGIGLAYLAALEALRGRDAVHAVEAEGAPFSEVLRWLAGRLEVARPVGLEVLFGEAGDRRRRLYIFLAALEMARREWLDVRQAEDGRVRLCLRRRVGAEELGFVKEDDI